jgi:mannitol-1-phosphate/altronate dehydrogenase
VCGSFLDFLTDYLKLSTQAFAQWLDQGLSSPPKRVDSLLPDANKGREEFVGKLEKLYDDRLVS